MKLSLNTQYALCCLLSSSYILHLLRSSYILMLTCRVPKGNNITVTFCTKLSPLFRIFPLNKKNSICDIWRMFWASANCLFWFSAHRLNQCHPDCSDCSFRYFKEKWRIYRLLHKRSFRERCKEARQSYLGIFMWSLQFNKASLELAQPEFLFHDTPNSIHITLETLEGTEKYIQIIFDVIDI